MVHVKDLGSRRYQGREDEIVDVNNKRVCCRQESISFRKRVEGSEVEVVRVFNEGKLEI